MMRTTNLVFLLTPIEVLDTAVKIGLGALVSGVTTYWIAKLNHDKTEAKEREQRRRDFLETIAEKVEIFHQAALKHWASTINWIAFTPKTEKMTEETRVELFKLRSSVADAFKELISAESKLLLLGELECQKLLREYGEHVTTYREEIIGQRTHTEDELLQYKQELIRRRDAFFTRLSKVYRNIQ